MKILDAGDQPLSNADVLDWIKRKRAQHEAEDTADKARGMEPTPRPSNFMTALRRHEAELSSDRYPYSANPNAYAGKSREKAFRRFAMAAESSMQDSLEAEWADRLSEMSKEQIEKEYAPLQEMKCLTEPEMLMLYNHAPTCVEMLQPMIENVQERFTDEEQAKLIDLIVRILRPDQPAPAT